MATTFDFGDGNGEVPAHRHKNSNGKNGGWVANTAFVAKTATIGEKCLVYGKATINDFTQVIGKARIYGEATLSDKVVISGSAEIFGNSVVCDYVKVAGNARVYGEARIYFRAEITGNAEVFGDVIIYNAADCQIKDTTKHKKPPPKKNYLMTRNNYNPVTPHDTDVFSYDENEFFDLQNYDYRQSINKFQNDKSQSIIRSLNIYDVGQKHWFENYASDCLDLFKHGRLPSWWNFREMFTLNEPVTVKKPPQQSTGFKIPPPPEPLQFNTERVAEIKTESKKLSAMLNAIYEQDETPPISSAPETAQNTELNLDEAHLVIVKILAMRPEWEREELQNLLKGVMLDGVLEHINEAFFDYCDEAFIEGDDPIEINVELYKEIFK